MKLLVAQSCPTLVTPSTVVHQDPLSMEFPMQEYWSGLPFPSPGFEPGSPAFQEDFEVNREASYVFIIKTKHATVTVEKKLI